MSPKKLSLVLIAALLLALPFMQVANAAPPQQDNSQERTVTVTGFGLAYGSPDIAQIGLAVESSNEDVMVAMESTNQRMNAVLQALQAAGVAAEDIRTTNFSIYQDYPYGFPEGQGGERPAATYRVSNNINVTVRDTNQVADLLAVAVSSGANIVNFVQFDIANRGELESEARLLAVEDARDRADQLAAALGFSVGQAVRINETTDFYGPVGLGGGGGDVMAASAPPISQGQLSVSMSVQITFELVAQ